MSGTVNKVILVGRLVRDPESRNLNDGSKVVHLSVATSDRWKDKTTGEQRERTEFHRVVIFNEHLTSVAERFLRKGSKVYLEGALQTRKWMDQSGQDRYITEVVLQRFKGELTMLDNVGGGSGSTDNVTDIHNRGFAPSGPQGKGIDLDDEIPY